jgi:cytochrome c biogenesis protein CcdA
MRNVWIFLVIFSLLVFCGVTHEAVQCEEAGNVCVYFFYGSGCLKCENVKLYIGELEQKYSQLSVQRFEVYGNRSSLSLLNSLFDKYGVPEDQMEIPAVFINDRCLVGEEQIKAELEEDVQSLLNTGCQCPSIPEDKAFTPISMLVVTWAGLADSINPCAIGVLIFLLSMLSASKDKRRLVIVGVAFTVSIYIAYFLFGLGILSAIQVTGLSYSFYRFVGILAIIIGILNFKDFLRYGSLGFTMELPQFIKLRLNNLLTAVTSPIGAFMTGFGVCLLELPCTGGPYFYILGLMAENTTRASAVPLLLYYNLIFVLPEILITLLIFLGISSTKKMTRLRHKLTRPLHLIMGLTMIALGIMAILELM